MHLQFPTVFAVVGVLTVRQVFGHEAQGSSGKSSADQVQHQETFDLRRFMYNSHKDDMHSLTKDIIFPAKNVDLNVINPPYLCIYIFIIIYF